MKSYILGIVVAMILSATYALSNTAEITVKILNLQTTLPQGIWEVIVFAFGVLIMWLISVCASIETYVKHRKKTKELTKRITQLEDERKSLLDTLRSFGWKDREEAEPHVLPEPSPKREEAPEVKTAYDHDSHRESEATCDRDKPELSATAEPPKNAEIKPFLLKIKTSISSIFKREKNGETEHDATETVSDKTDEQTACPENVCLMPESAEEYDAESASETEDKEKFEI
ncbi:MAG: LapA family protein [Synergistaceae bacterium]|jgi:uncharacterized integral membrane protein|nr:LapA family protein [Synergistaceae bacterium]